VGWREANPLDILTRSARPADIVLRYGPLPEHVADLRLPEPVGAVRPSASRSRPTWPLVIFLHGGFWRAAYDRAHTGPIAAALAADGFAVCAPEYRRVGQPGGGWPGTFDDVAAAVHLLPGLAASATGGRTGVAGMVLGGHSAGGHLALWAASRHRLPARSPSWSERPSAVGVVGLAAVSELAVCYEQRLGRGAAGALMDGGPRDRPDRYAVGDPAVLLPVGVPVRLLHGTADENVPCQMSVDYAARARAAGDVIDCEILPGAGHFELIDPLSAEWPRVVAAFRDLASEAGSSGAATGGRG
jgi:acetyl esterase/lipase